MHGRRRAIAGGLALALTLVWPARRARAWNDFGHMEVAAVAFAALKPQARTRVAALLKLNPRYAIWIAGAKKRDQPRVAFLRAATWADAIKGDRAYKDDDPIAPAAGQPVGYADLSRHKAWHYVDQPFSPDGTPTVEPGAPNAATQIARFRADLCSAQIPAALKSYELAWLLHLVGDVHQPLHCISRFDSGTPQGDRGGNLVKISDNQPPVVCDDPRYCPYGPPTELHAFFDGIAGAGYGVAEVDAATVALPKASVKKASIVDEQIWIGEGFELAAHAIYVPPIGAGPGPFSVDDAYQKAALALGKRQISLAGARLANLLNACLSP